jgi:site-specific DNA-methyltransferase (adenine-specific)
VDDVVLDPFSGSGTTLIAAVSNSRKGIGIDVDRKYCELARKRILESTEPVQVELPRKKVVKKKIAADKNG